MLKSSVEFRRTAEFVGNYLWIPHYEQNDIIYTSL